MGMIYLDDAIEAIASRDETDGTYNVFSGKQVIDILKSLPSAEPKTPSNGSITCVKSEKMHVRTMGDLISRQDAIDIERRATVDTNPSHFDSHQKFEQFMDDVEISSFGRWQWANGFNTALTAISVDLKQLPSAEKAQLSEEDATKDATSGLIRRQDVLHWLDGCDYELKDWQRWKLKTMVRDIPSAEGCKCPCEYREPCDYCHYDAYREHGCPAEEGMKDG